VRRSECGSEWNAHTETLSSKPKAICNMFSRRRNVTYCKPEADRRAQLVINTVTFFGWRVDDDDDQVEGTVS
jgi:hypothetical protein